MKGLILYQGKYGATLQYAEWLSEALHLPVRTADQVTEQALAEAEYVLMGTSVYLGKFTLRDWLQKHATALSGKKLFLFVVSGLPAGDTARQEAYLADNVPDILRPQLEVYSLPGRLRYQKLSWPDKLRCRIGALLTRDPQTRTSLRTEYNGVKKEHLLPLLQAAGQLNPAPPSPAPATEIPAVFS
jgi:menaquinone-dependent protoporphyrinogen IX oxidase